MAGSMSNRRLGRLVLLGLIGLALLSGACRNEATISGGGATLDPPARLHELASIATLQDAFNDDAGATRLILLVSPT